MNTLRADLHASALCCQTRKLLNRHWERNGMELKRWNLRKMCKQNVQPPQMGLNSTINVEYMIVDFIMNRITNITIK